MALTPKQLRELRQSDAAGRVKAARLAADLTQEQLAAAIGVTQSAISDMERQRYPSTTIETARKYTDFFGCAIEDLFPARESVKAS